MAAQHEGREKQQVAVARDSQQGAGAGGRSHFLSLVVLDLWHPGRGEARSACTMSAMRLAKGAETRRTQVPAASARPISSCDKPRSLTNAGRNGEATP
jgi:hypothetical protein